MVLLKRRTNEEGEPAVLGGRRLQQEQFLLLDEDEHGGRMKQHAKAVGDALHHGSRVGQAMQCGGYFDQNAGAAAFFAGKLILTEGFGCGADLGPPDSDLCYTLILKTSTGP